MHVAKGAAAPRAELIEVGSQEAVVRGLLRDRIRKRLVEAHEGTIRYDASRNAFAVTLPLAR